MCTHMLPSGNSLLYSRCTIENLREKIQYLQFEGDSIRPEEHPLIRAGVQWVRGEGEPSESDTCRAQRLKLNTARGVFAIRETN